MTLLNLGSGQRRFEGHGWINLDCVSRPGQVPDVVCDVLMEPLPFERNSVDLIVLYHVLEHWVLQDAIGVLHECHRVLSDNGSLIVVVPDLRALAQRWLTRSIDDYIYIVNLMGAYQGEIGDIHKWHWTPQSLGRALRECGFSTVRGFDWRVIPGAESICKDWWYYGIEAAK